MIEILTADITKLEVDAIVNAANCSLPGGRSVKARVLPANRTLPARMVISMHYEQFE